MPKVNFFDRDQQYDSREHQDEGRYFRRWLDNAVEAHAKSDRIRHYPVWLSRVEAAVILERNKLNRNPTLAGMLKIFNQMENDTFVDAPDPIVFDKDGILSSGQNRMGALLNSDKHFPFSLAFGQERKNVAISQDLGVFRSSHNVLTERGEPIPTSLLRAFYFPPLQTWRAMSPAEVIALVDLVRPEAKALLEIVDYCESRQMLRQKMPVLGAFLRAMYRLPHATIFRFLELFAAGPQATITKEYERNPLVLRDLVARTKQNSNCERSGLFMRTAHALRAFAEHRVIQVIKMQKDPKKWTSPFELPPEVKILKATWDDGLVKVRSDIALTARSMRAKLEEYRQND